MSGKLLVWIIVVLTLACWGFILYGMVRFSNWRLKQVARLATGEEPPLNATGQLDAGDDDPGEGARTVKRRPRDFSRVRIPAVPSFVESAGDHAPRWQFGNGVCPTHGKAVLVTHIDGEPCTDYLTPANAPPAVVGSATADDYPSDEELVTVLIRHATEAEHIQLTAAERRVGELTKALRKYGSHLGDCESETGQDATIPCTCGFAAAARSGEP